MIPIPKMTGLQFLVLTLLFDGPKAGRELRRELDRSFLLRLFRQTGGDIREMGRALGVRRSNLYTWLRKVGIDIRELRNRS